MRRSCSWASTWLPHYTTCIYYHYHYYHYYYCYYLLSLLLIIIIYTYMHYTYIWSYRYLIQSISVIQSANKSSLNNSTRPRLRCSEHVSLAAAGAFPSPKNPSGADKRHLIRCMKPKKQQKTLNRKPKWCENMPFHFADYVKMKAIVGAWWQIYAEVENKYMKSYHMPQKICRIMFTHFPGK